MEITMQIRVLAAASVVVWVAAAAEPFVAAQESGLPPGLARAQAIARADTGVGQYFTAAQTLRGEELYNRHCGYCHYANVGAMPTMSGIRGQTLAPRMLQKEVEGITRYPTAYHFFRRLEYMPPNDVDSVTPQERADILAYLLQQNGLMPGPSELQPNHGMMAGMPLPAEPGFVHVFNGRDLGGLQFLFGYHCSAPPEGCGKTDPDGIVWVKDGVLATNGRIHGMIFLPNKYKDFTLRLEQRVALPWDGMDELIQDQTGILLFVGSKGGQVRTWPDTMIEIEGKYHELLSAYAHTLKIKATLDRAARRRVIKPVHQWQRLEIVSRDGSLRNYLNGTLVSTAEILTDDVDPGHIALQTQGGPVEWRNIRIKVE